MNKKIGELKISKLEDYYDTVAKALDKAGYILVLEFDDICERHYVIAKTESENKK